MQHIIKIPALTAKIYETTKGKFSVELGGFYNIHAPLEDAIDCAEKHMKRVALGHIERQVKAMRRRLKREAKSKTIRS